MTTLDPKDPDVAETYSIDWRDELVPLAFRDHAFQADDVARPQIATGWYYVATPLNAESSGWTKRHWPTWPRADGATVVDGTIQWTAVHPAEASVPSVASATWEVPSGITKDSQTELVTVTRVVLSGGSDGEDYELVCRMTPTSGTPKEQTIIVPVRAQ